MRYTNRLLLLLLLLLPLLLQVTLSKKKALVKRYVLPEPFGRRHLNPSAMQQPKLQERGLVYCMVCLFTSKLSVDRANADHPKPPDREGGTKLKGPQVAVSKLNAKKH